MRSRSLLRGAAGLVTAAAMMTAAASTPAAANPPTAAGDGTAGDFLPVTPARILDTRASGPLGPGETRPLTVAGVGGVPEAARVSAVVLGVTATGPTEPGYVAVHAWGAARPDISNLNLVPGRTTANTVVSAVDAAGTVALYNAAGSAHVLVDVLGWYSTGAEPGGSRFLPVTPLRIADTRPDRPIFGHEALLFELKDKPPYDKVEAAVLNVTATQPQGEGYFAVTPGNVGPSGTSTLNFLPGQTVAGSTVTGIGPDRRVAVHNASPLPVHQVVDLSGLFVERASVNGGAFTPVAPYRLFDSRLVPAGPLGAGETRPLSVSGGPVPAEVGAVVLNVTVVAPTADTWVSLWPATAARPGVSSVNAGPGETVPNLVTVAAAGGTVQLYNASGSAHVVVDVVGWYSRTTAAASPPALPLPL